MSGYLFIFGNTPDLSFAELSLFFPAARRLRADVALVTEVVSAAQIMGKLGGTVKIAEVVATVKSVDVQSLVAAVMSGSPRAVTVGISSYAASFRVRGELLDQLKRELTGKGIPTRYIAGKESGPLSSVVVSKQRVTELIVANEGSDWYLGKTVAVQDFEAWNRRDYGRPAVDPKAGMLPPKVARMAVNLAYSEPRTTNLEPRILLDPLCGVGTILAEALLVGWNVIGSDQSEEAIEKTRKNIKWLEGSDTSRKYPILPSVKLFVCDATHTSERMPPESVDAIVTEPFLGSQSHGVTKVRNIIKGLEKLYIGCLKDWKKILKPGGKVVIALPEYAISGKTYFVKKVIDNCETLGYTILAGPIAYHRPQAMVRRKFFVFRRNDLMI